MIRRSPRQPRLSLMLSSASLLSAGLVAAPLLAQQPDAPAAAAATEAVEATQAVEATEAAAATEAANDAAAAANAAQQPAAAQSQVAPPAAPQQRPLRRLGDRVREEVGRAVGEAGEQVGRAVDRVLPRDQIATTEVDVVAEDEAMRVRQVWPNSYASRLDLQPGDRIVTLDGQPIRSEAQFYDLWSTRATQYPAIVVLRNGQRVVLRRVPELIEAPTAEGRPVLGVYLTDSALGPQVERVVAGSAADRAGIVAGDYIVSVGNADTDTEAQVNAAVSQHPLDRPMQLTYQRRNHNTDVLIRFTDPDGASPEVNVDTNVTVARPALPEVVTPPAPPASDDVLRRLEALEAEVNQLRGAVRVLTEQSAD